MGVQVDHVRAVEHVHRFHVFPIREAGRHAGPGQRVHNFDGTRFARNHLNHGPGDHGFVPDMVCASVKAELSVHVEAGLLDSESDRLAFLTINVL